MSLKRTLVYYYKKIMRQKDSPEKISYGFAVGIFFGVSPAIGLHTILAIGSAFLLKLNKVSAFVGTIISGNPFTLPLIFALEHKIGGLFVGNTDHGVSGFSDLTFEILIRMGWDVIIKMFLGSFIIGVPLAVLSYYISRRLVVFYREKKADAKES